ncbi:MAG TPA: TetR family transcriptional regulator C-terminal domain-containing protein [Solirubrobacteraceae bacterium]|nr:TetR family transcriptional regulator C-terminal domain-containing protein [Solirubrobacteraceae bacterium]
MPAPRRTSARGESQRQRIVDAALEAIRASPVADVQLAAIADRAGLKPSHILYYFPSRDAVLIATVAHAEERLAEGRAERLRTIEDPNGRLRAYVRAYLPDDRHDPVWKLWIEGWLRSASREAFRPVGADANLRWRADLIETLEHAAGARGRAAGSTTAIARRLNFLLDGLAIHVLSGKVTPGDAEEVAMAAIRAELDAAGR